MINGKIKEWHMDPALLQKLATGGTVNLDSLMRDYIKKTDIITEDQLDPDILTEIDNQVARIQSLLDNYRLKADAISLQDIDTEFSTLLENLQNHSGGGSTAFDTSEIEAYINDAIDTKLASEVESAVSNVIEDVVDAAIVEKFDDAFNAATEEIIDAKIGDAVETAMADSPVFTEVRQEILDTVAETYTNLALTESIQNDIEELWASQDAQDIAISSQSSQIEALQQDINGARKTEDAIGYEDLDPSIADQLNQIAFIQAELSTKQRSLSGEQGQIITFNSIGEPIVQDLVLWTDIAANTEELNAAKNTLARTIYDIGSLQKLTLDRRLWNYNVLHNIMTEHGTIQEDGLSYGDAVLSAENLDLHGVTAEITDGIISFTNDSLIDTGSATFGFYGTRLKLFTTITVPNSTEESGTEEDPQISPQLIKKEYSVLIDGKLPYETTAVTMESIEHTCFLCVENLSEGMHRIDIQVLPGETVMIDAVISIDDEHAALAAAEDIKPESFYNGNIYDTGDYVTEPAYDNIKSENVSLVTSDEYESEALDFNNIEKRLIYSPLAKKLYYCYNKAFVLLSSDQESRLADLEQRLAALEGA